MAGFASAGFASVASAVANVDQSLGSVTVEEPTRPAHLAFIGIEPVTLTPRMPGLSPATKCPSPAGSPSTFVAAAVADRAKSEAASSRSDGRLMVIHPATN